MEFLQTVRDFFEYSEGNVTGLYICLMISLGSILLFIFSFPLEKAINGVKGTANKVKTGVKTEAPVVKAMPTNNNANEQVFVFCRNCGKQIKATAAFCPHCGEKK